MNNYVNNNIISLYATKIPKKELIHKELYHAFHRGHYLILVGD